MRTPDGSTAENIIKPFLQAEITERVRVALLSRQRPAEFVPCALAIDHESRIGMADPTETGASPAPRCAATRAAAATATHANARAQ